MKKLSFLARRKSLLEKMDSEGILVLPAAYEQNERYLYRQDSDFYYLTGFEESHAVAVFFQKKGNAQFILFNRPESKETAIWEGALTGQKGACVRYGADVSYPIDQLEAHFFTLLEGYQKIYYPIGRYPEFDHFMMKQIKKLQKKRKVGGDVPLTWIHSDLLLDEMRLMKDATEVQHLRKAAQISAQAHRAVMQLCRPGLYEYTLKAKLLSIFIEQGADGEAYPSIVAGGQNACVLHYHQNRDVLKAGTLVLVDAGASYGYYAADITRTFPVSGRFTSEQARLYECVLEAQMAVIHCIRPGILFSELQEKAVQVLTKGLVKIGLLKGDISGLIEQKAYTDFFMHGVSHWLGIDVHDVGCYRINGQLRSLAPGMVLTVEPGLYLSSDHLDLPSKWRDIGIRIEDDVLVTETGCEVLSADVPKTLREIEALMQ